MLKSNKESIPLLTKEDFLSRKKNIETIFNKNHPTPKQIDKEPPKVQNPKESQDPPIFKSNIDNDKFTKACIGLKNFPYIDKVIDGSVIKYRLILPEDQKRTILLESLLENLQVIEAKKKVKTLVDSFNEFLDTLNQLIEKSDIVKKTGQGIDSLTVNKIMEDLDLQHEKLVQHSKESWSFVKKNQEILKDELKKNIKKRNISIGVSSGLAAAGTAALVIGIVLSPLTAGISLIGTAAGAAIMFGGGVVMTGGVTAAVFGGKFFKLKMLPLDQAIKELDKLDKTIDNIILTFRGYKEEFINQIKDSMQTLVDHETEYLGANCLICHEIAEDPVIVPNLRERNQHESTTYCKKCIVPWVEINGTNPKTREPLSVNGIWMSERETYVIKGLAEKAKKNMDTFLQRLENIQQRRLDEINNQTKLNFKNSTNKK